MKACDSVLMIGTHPRTMGGIATVVRGYMEDGLFEREPIEYVVTHCDGSAARKLFTALRAVWRAFIVMASRRPLLHVHLSSRASFWRKSVFCLMARGLRRPYLLHMHGSEFMKFYDEECGALAKATVRSVFTHASLLIALSEQWRENLARICPGATIEVLPNAVPLPDLDSRRADDGQMRLVFLGRLGTRKGTFDLVRGFAAIANAFPGARLICAGDGAIDETRALAAAVGIGERVECPGWVDPQAGSRLLAGATLFALPSHAEGLPMALLEAMAWGLPVLTTPVGGIPDAVRALENGYLINPGEPAEISRALETLLASAELRSRLGRAARATIEQRFSLRAATSRLERIYARYGVTAGKAVG